MEDNVNISLEGTVWLESDEFMWITVWTGGMFL
jgi:hypothetical protein